MCDATLYLVLFFQYEFVYLIDCVSEDGISLLFCNHNLNIGIECLSFMNQILLELKYFTFCIDLMCFRKLPFSINL